MEETISNDPKMTQEDKALLKRKLMKFACGTCDMGSLAPPNNVDALPEIAKLLMTEF